MLINHGLSFDSYVLISLVVAALAMAMWLTIAECKCRVEVKSLGYHAWSVWIINYGRSIKTKIFSCSFYCFSDSMC